MTTKEIKTLADLEAASSTECAVWFGKKLFKLRKKKEVLYNGAVIDGYEYHVNGSKCWDTVGNYVDWIFSMEGTEEIKEAMVQQGWSYLCHRYAGNDFLWFQFYKDSQEPYEAEGGAIEATWKAAALALLGE